MKLFKKTETDYEVWKDRYNHANFEFPGGINDWFAFATLLGFFIFPIIILTVKFDVDIYTNKMYYWIIFIVLAAFCYYWIYHKNIDWLKERIDKANKKYYIK